MSTFIVRIRETLERTVKVPNVSSSDEALSVIKNSYGNCEIVLDSGDFTAVVFKAKPELEESRGAAC